MEQQTQPNQEPTPEQPKQPEAELFQKIAKQDKYIQAERTKLAEANKSLEMSRKEAETYKSLRSKDPFEILEHFGVTYDKLVEVDKQRRRSPIDPHVKKALDEVNALKEQIKQERDSLTTEKLSRAEVKLVSDIEQSIKENEYDLISHLGGQQVVRDYMEEVFASTGNVPTVREACEAVNEYMAEKVLKVKDSKWLRPKEEGKKAVEKESKPSKTLSNKLVQTSAATVISKPTTVQGYREAALALLKELKKN